MSHVRKPTRWKLTQILKEGVAWFPERVGRGSELSKKDENKIAFSVFVVTCKSRKDRRIFISVRISFPLTHKIDRHFAGESPVGKHPSIKSHYSLLLSLFSSSILADALQYHSLKFGGGELLSLEYLLHGVEMDPRPFSIIWKKSHRTPAFFWTPSISKSEIVAYLVTGRSMYTS